MGKTIDLSDLVWICLFWFRAWTRACYFDFLENLLWWNMTNIEHNIVFRYCLSTVEPDHSFTSSVNIERPLSPRRPVFNFNDINKNDEEITTIRCAHNKGYSYDKYYLISMCYFQQADKSGRKCGPVWNNVSKIKFRRQFASYYLEVSFKAWQKKTFRTYSIVKLRLRSDSRSGSLRLLLCDFDSVTWAWS